jgi:Polyketide cyclase / dehydrase and lipid transport
MLDTYRVIIVVVSILIVLIVIISKRPSTFSYTRTLSMPHPVEKIFPHVNSLKKWHDWSPWAQLDPACKTTYEGPDVGIGAIMKWDGNKKVGMGSMMITSSLPNTRIMYRLTFIKPFKGTSEAEISFKPEANGTLVSWTMTGHNNFIAKAMSLFMDCEKMIGDKFDEGLDNLDETVAKAA